MHFAFLSCRVMFPVLFTNISLCYLLSRPGRLPAVTLLPSFQFYKQSVHELDCLRCGEIGLLRVSVSSHLLHTAELSLILWTFTTVTRALSLPFSSELNSLLRFLALSFITITNCVSPLYHSSGLLLLTCCPFWVVPWSGLPYNSTEI